MMKRPAGLICLIKRCAAAAMAVLLILLLCACGEQKDTASTPIPQVTDVAAMPVYSYATAIPTGAPQTPVSYATQAPVYWATPTPVYYATSAPAYATAVPAYYSTAVPSAGGGAPVGTWRMEAADFFTFSDDPYAANYNGYVLFDFRADGTYSVNINLYYSNGSYVGNRTADGAYTAENGQMKLSSMEPFAWWMSGNTLYFVHNNTMIPLQRIM